MKFKENQGNFKKLKETQGNSRKLDETQGNSKATVLGTELPPNHSRKLMETQIKFKEIQGNSRKLKGDSVGNGAPTSPLKEARRNSMKFEET